MSNFDAVTFGEVLDGKPPVGSVVRVVDSFSNPKYVKSDEIFNINDYPLLADQVDEGFQGGLWRKIDNIPAIPDDTSTSLGSSVWGGIGNTIFAWTSGSNNYFLQAGASAAAYGYRLYKSAGTTFTGGETITLVKAAAAPAAQRFSMSNSRLFLSDNTKQVTIWDLSTDPEMSSGTVRNLGAAGSLTTYTFVEGASSSVIVGQGNATAATTAIVRSSDGGATWANASSIGSLTSILQSIAYSPSAARFVVQSAATATGNSAWSTDGASWTSVLVVAVSRLKVLYDASRSLFMSLPSTAGVIYESANGATWSAAGTLPIVIPSDGNPVITPDGTLVFWRNDETSTTTAFSNSSSLYTSVGAKTSFTLRSLSSYDSFSIIGNKIIRFSGEIEGGPASVLYADSTDTSTWTTANLLTRDQAINVVSARIGSTIVLIANSQVAQQPTGSTNAVRRLNGLVSSNGGTSWSTLTINLPTGSTISPRIATTASGFIMVGKVNRQTTAANFLVVKSTNGITWNVTSLSSPATVTAVNHLASNADGVLMVSMNNTSAQWRSSDNGVSWQAGSLSSGSGYAYVHSITSGFLVTAAAQASPSSSNFQRSNNSGTTMGSTSSVPSGITNFSIAGCCAGIQGTNSILALVSSTTTATSKSIWYSIDNGVNWFASVLPSGEILNTFRAVTLYNPQNLGANCMALIDGYIVIVLGTSLTLRTNNILDDAAWEMGRYGALNEDDEFEELSDAVTMLSNMDGGVIGLMHGPATIAAGYILSASSTETEWRKMDYMPSDVNGTTWAVLSK